jgi:hypothetical protein
MSRMFNQYKRPVLDSIDNGRNDIVRKKRSDFSLYSAIGILQSNLFFFVLRLAQLSFCFPFKGGTDYERDCHIIKQFFIWAWLDKKSFRELFTTKEHLVARYNENGIISWVSATVIRTDGTKDHPYSTFNFQNDFRSFHSAQMNSISVSHQ